MLEATILKFEDDKIILQLIDGQEIKVNKNELTGDVKEGEKISLIFKTTSEKKEILNDILKDKD